MTAKLLRAAGAAAALAAKVVRLVVPQAPGGASDALARITAQKLAEKWGQQVIVENRAGAGGNIGTDAVANSADDGYTLLPDDLHALLFEERGVGFEDRQDLLGHRSSRITTHYSAAELSKLIEAANRVCESTERRPELVALRRRQLAQHAEVITAMLKGTNSAQPSEDEGAGTSPTP